MQIDSTVSARYFMSLFPSYSTNYNSYIASTYRQCFLAHFAFTKHTRARFPTDVFAILKIILRQTLHNFVKIEPQLLFRRK